MREIPAEVWVGLIVFAGTVLTVIFTRQGKAEEARSDRLRSLIEGQAREIERLSRRMDRMDQKYAYSASHSWDLRRELSHATDHVLHVQQWDDAGRDGNLPRSDRIGRWKSLLDKPIEKPDD